MCVKYVILEILHKLYHKQSDLNMRFKAAQNSILFSFLVFSFFSCSYKQQQVLFEHQEAVVDKGNVENGNGTSDYHIQSQDILQIRNLQNVKYIVDEAPATSGVGGATEGGSGTITAGQGQTYQVEDDGTVGLPVIGHIPVSGLTRAEAQKKIEELYKKDLLKDPIIELKITNLKVTILGEIKVQGNFPLIKDKTSIVEMIGLAGGLTDKANEKNIKIIRGDPKNPQIMQFDLSNIKTLSDPRIILQNNDIIYIAQNKRAVKNDQLQNVTSTLQPGLIILNTALIIYTLIHR